MMLSIEKIKINLRLKNYCLLHLEASYVVVETNFSTSGNVH